MEEILDMSKFNINQKWKEFVEFLFEESDQRMLYLFELSEESRIFLEKFSIRKASIGNGKSGSMLSQSFDVEFYFNGERGEYFDALPGFEEKVGSGLLTARSLSSETERELFKSAFKEFVSKISKENQKGEGNES